MVWISRRHGLAALSGLSWLAGQTEAAEPDSADSAVTNVAIIGLWPFFLCFLGPER